jgi:uncharacterized protein
MQEITKHEQGSFCWIDLATIGAEDAKKFYAEVFGWETVDSPAGEGVFYTMLNLNGKSVAGLYEMGPQQKEQNLPPHWANYVAVENADEVLGKVGGLGGKVIMEAADIMDVGRMGVLQDPTGAFLAVWQPKAHIGASYRNVAGAFCWNELATNDTDKAQEFYTSLFGWTAKSQQMGHMMYTTFYNGENMAAGMYELLPEMEGVPPHWLPYIQLADIKSTIKKASSLGAKVLAPVMFVEGVGHFAVIQDPQGAALGVLE